MALGGYGQVTMTAESNHGGELSMVGVAIVLLRRRRTIAVVTLLAVILGIAAGLLAKRTYTASASFMPQSSGEDLSRLSTIAAQFGVPALGGRAGQSPDFYAALVTSRQILGGVADSRFTLGDIGNADRPGGLPEILRIREDSAPVRRERIVDALRDRVGAVADAKTGLVEVTVRMPRPDLSQQVLARILELLNEFNLRTRQSQARAERVFVEGRLGEVRGELREAEDRLQAFLTSNRDFNSPQLKFQQDRLQREVQMRQQLVNGLVQSYEQSRIDEVRDTPVITVVESVTRPVEPDSRRLLVRAIVALLLGGMLGILVGFLREFAQSRRDAGDPTFHDLVLLRRQAVEDFKRPWRLLRVSRE